MTAEVAVMNRSAVALAADSAVTLSGLDPNSEVDKIFQNENKLFELSAKFPVGIMLYNATNFFGIPWEVIIKDFRTELGNESCTHIFGWAEKFRNFVVSHPIFCPTVDRQKAFVEFIFSKEFSSVHGEWGAKAEALFFARQTKLIKAKYPQIMTDVLRHRISLYERHPYFDAIDDAEGSRILSVYADEFNKAKNETFGALPLDDIHQELIQNLAKCVVSRSRPQGFTTGLVFAGFGSDELFPSLISLEIGGFVDGKMRWVEKEKVDIDRATTTAEIIPFAQRETVDTLVFGRSDRYENRVVAHFAEAVRQVGNGLVEQLTGKGPKRKDFQGRVDAAVKGVIDRFQNEQAKRLKTIFGNDTLDIVRHMPKPDLAAFAESLVTVSSMKRKVTVGPETVGGPVDVAVISRHEGFIWVKRKLYFDPDLNRRYIARVFGSK